MRCYFFLWHEKQKKKAYLRILIIMITEVKSATPNAVIKGTNDSRNDAPAPK